MKQILLLSTVVLMSLLYSCTSKQSNKSESKENQVTPKAQTEKPEVKQEKSEEDTIQFTNIKSGDKLGLLTVAESSADEYGMVLKFSDEIEVNGTLYMEQGPPAFFIQTDLLEGKIKSDHFTTDLSNLGGIMVSFDKIEKLIPDDWKVDGTDYYYLKEEINGKRNVKVILKNIVYESNTPFQLAGDIVKIVEFDGKKLADQATKSQANNVLKFEHIKKGDEIEGLTVTELYSQANDKWSIQLKGDKIVAGKLIYNDFEDSYDFLLDKELAAKIKIEFEQQIYDLYSNLAIQNRNKLLKALNDEQKSALKSGKEVPIKIKVNNFSVGVKLDKGRMGIGWCDFVEIL